MDHVLDGHNVPKEIKRASLQKLFPPWQLHENSMQNLCRLNVRAFRMTYCCLARWDCRWLPLSRAQREPASCYVSREVLDTAARALTDENDHSDSGETTQYRRPPGGIHKPDG